MPITTGIIGLYQGVVENQIDKFRRYLKLMEPQITTSRDAWETEKNKLASGITDPDERNDFFEFYAEEYWEFEEYEMLLRNFFLVSVFAYLESQLGRMCEFVMRRKKIALNWKELKGSTLDCAAKYLDRLGGVESPKKSPVWQKIQKYARLRNSIIHEDARLKREDKDTWNFARRKGIISADGTINENEIKITPALCEALLKDVRLFLVKQYDYLRDI